MPAHPFRTVLVLLLFASTGLGAWLGPTAAAEEPWRRARVAGADSLGHFGSSDDGAVQYALSFQDFWRSNDGGRTWRWHAWPGWITLAGAEIRVHPDDPEIVLLEASLPEEPTVLGVALSRDGGASWTFSPLAGADGSPDGTTIGFVEVYGFGHDGAIYASRDQVYRSDDSGKTWTVTVLDRVGLRAETVFAGRDGTLLVTGPQTPLELAVSFDGGRSATRVSLPDSLGAARLVEVRPSDVRQWILTVGSLFALTRDAGSSFAQRRFGSEIYSTRFHPTRTAEIYVLGQLEEDLRDGATLWVSRDDGASFETYAVPDSLGATDLYFDACDPSTLYGISPLPGFVVRSRDSGRTWQDVSFLAVGTDIYGASSRVEGCELLIRSEAGLFVSSDAGDSWAEAGDGLPAGDYSAVVFDPRTPGRVYAGGPSGFLLSEDGGRSWRRNRGFEVPVVDIVLAGDEQRVLVLQGFGSIATSDDGGESFDSDLFSLGQDSLLGDPFDRDRVLVRRPVSIDPHWTESTDGGRTFDRGLVARDGDRTFQVDGLAFDPYRAGHLVGWTLAASDEIRFVRSSDYGESFELGAQVGERVGPRAVVRIDREGTLYLVSDGLFSRSTDGGETFESVSTPIDQFFELRTDRRSAGVLYATGVDRERPLDRRVFRSLDRGTTWQDWSDGMRFGNGLAQSPSDADLFVAMGDDPYRRHLGEPGPCGVDGRMGNGGAGDDRAVDGSAVDGSAGDGGAVDGSAGDGDVLCLDQDRFELEVRWQNADGVEGIGRLVPAGTRDSGLFYFFESDNWEMLVKVLDGCAINRRFWVLAAATTDVEYALTVRDQASGKARKYFNAQGEQSPAIIDTDAFDTCPDPGRTAASPSSVDTAPSAFLEPASTDPRSTEGLAGSVAADEVCPATELCVQQGRFRVRVDWQNADGAGGSGLAVDFRSDDSGLFYFFDAENWELLIKVLDGCAINQRFWVLGAAVTDVAYRVRVLDTWTGLEQSYVNPLGTASPAIIDTGAFASCDAVPIS